MRVLKFAVTIGEDHTLHLRLPDDVSQGRAEVIVQLPEEPSASPQGEGMSQFLESLKDRPWRLKSKEEIDAELREERDGWREP